MKIFPEKVFSIELINESSTAILELKNQTLSKEQFVINWKNQAFIGEIEKNEFEIKLSKKFYGEFCIIKGKLENKVGILEIRTSRIFKIIFISIILFALSGIIAAIIQNKINVILSLVLTIIVIRFIFIELGFRYVSKSGINKLTEIIGIKKLKKALYKN